MPNKLVIGIKIKYQLTFFYKLNLNEIKTKKTHQVELNKTICNHKAQEAINIFDRFNNPQYLKQAAGRCHYDLKKLATTSNADRLVQ